MTNKSYYSIVAFSRFSDSKMESAITPEEVAFTQKALKYMLRLMHQVPCEAKTPNQQAFLCTAESWMQEYHDIVQSMNRATDFRKSYSEIPSSNHNACVRKTSSTNAQPYYWSESIQDTLQALNGGQVHTQDGKMSVLWPYQSAARHRNFDE